MSVGWLVGWLVVPPKLLKTFVTRDRAGLGHFIEKGVDNSIPIPGLFESLSPFEHLLMMEVL